ncbi:hypothetical protein ASPVEDRAFT_44806 [Aspergillus versicolor CBS 583.65]|uniref:Zeta toxin domain-containing protein n=1 Tax=Aspergillus versicolor CBS 583.65 TaxID=1036611 RepID=A0A1L9PUW8_ASPVE|nr:uncharacterized protein ASPVEDRAFT_44806 [Aspergillus versicolor CBS 583.65]OJJ05311.1 hypothetical protein ASPVEDRAFT_44806 [Aspergillus versicolor CBS 583.65]
MPETVLTEYSSLSGFLSRTENDPRPVVAMTCGVAGSGKSTVSKWITSNHQSFKRLSIDAYIYTKYGLYGVDYPKDKYNDLQEEAEPALRTELVQLLHQGSHDIILDLSLAFQATRDTWKALVEGAGGRWVLMFIEVDPDELRRRVRARNHLTVKDGDSAYFVTEQVLESFIAGFERPTGEGELVLRLENRAV